MAATIVLTKGKAALVDDGDYAAISAHRWHASAGEDGRFYAARRESRRDGHRTILMHRVVLGLPIGRKPEVDHVNGDGLDNRRANLRVATSRENKGNVAKRVSRPTSSRFKGVSWDKGTARWRADITVVGRHRFLGRFDDETAAAKAYDAAAVTVFGEFARGNDAR